MYFVGNFQLCTPHANQGPDTSICSPIDEMSPCAHIDDGEDKLGGIVATR